MARPITRDQAKRLVALRRDCQDLMRRYDANDQEARSILGIADGWLDTAGHVYDYLNGISTRKRLLRECEAYIEPAPRSRGDQEKG